jgi:hypothetical protein
VSTTDLGALYATVRNRLLAASDASGSMVSILGSGNAARLYQVAPPAGAVFPYALLRFVNELTSDEFMERSTADLEVMIYARPQGTGRPQARRISQLVDVGLKQWADASDGLIRVTSRQRDELPQGAGDVDSEVVTIRHLVSCYLWPSYLTAIPT